jgi:hypothetical protein
VLVVKVEVWPGGDPAKAEPLDVLLITNTGKHPETIKAQETPDLFEYMVTWQSNHHRRARVFHWRRRGWKKLVVRALEALDG